MNTSHKQQAERDARHLLNYLRSRFEDIHFSFQVVNASGFYLIQLDYGDESGTLADDVQRSINDLFLATRVYARNGRSETIIDGGRCNTYYLNVGQQHWSVCEQHGIRWCLGSGIFSSHKYETPADWAWNVAWLDQFRVATADDEARCEGYKRRGWTDTGGQLSEDGGLSFGEVPF